MQPVTTSQTFDAPLDKVWNALTEESEIKKWYFPVENYVFDVGNEFTFYESADSKEYLHRCKFLNIVPKKMFEHTWEHPTHSKGSSVVKWELESEGEKTKVTLTHTGTENFTDAGDAFLPANFQMGWDAIVKNNLRNYLYGIEKLEFKIEINATASIVWKKLWDKKSYPEWTAPFCEGSYYEGKLAQGNRIHFLSPTDEGMYSDLVFYKENALAAFKHIGILKDKQELPIDGDTEKWTGSFEIYRLTEKDGISTVKVEMDCVPEYVNHMKNAFSKGLEKQKQISENA